uniref:Uncharacterized protein n=1 Tax=Auxenochlorella protothecoides TaxID=3075 RepID=A0A1D2A8K0_AUXPR
MSLRFAAPDGVKVYTVAGGKNLPTWVSDKKKRSLRKDEDYNRRVELVQDFEFPAACQRIKVSADQQYIFASGYHPPRVRVYDVNQLSLKFERHLNAEIVDFQILSEDYSKAVFLCDDRRLDFHAKFGSYHKTRVPRAGRCLTYSHPTAELFVAGSAPEIWRLSLEEGRFMAPMPAASPGVNALGLSPAHGLLAAAGEEGLLECYDPRVRASVGSLEAARAAGADGQGLTALRFDDSGMHVAVGTSGGLVAVFDLRSQRPMVVKDHQYESPILDIKWPTTAAGRSRALVASADRHIIKFWDAASGEGFTNIEPKDGDINDICLWPGSGLVMAGCDTPRIQAYFIPALGPAPKWSSFLESMTEELEERTAPAVYDDYRFITRAELDSLGLANLVGTNMLKPYMHGFFLDNRLYNKAKNAVDPFAYEAYRAKRVAQKLEEERKSRISIIKKLPKVNATTAARLLGEEGEDGPKKRKAALPNLLEDTRFKAMFEDTEFTIDEASRDYKLLHPNADPAKERRLVREHFEAVEGDGDAQSASDTEGQDDDQTRARKPAARHRDKRQHREAEPAAPAGAPRLYEARDAAAAAAFRAGRSLVREQAQPLGERLAAGAGGTGNARQRSTGNKELAFRPRMAPDGVDWGGGGGGRGRGGRGRGRGRGSSPPTGSFGSDGGSRGRGGGGGRRGRGGRSGGGGGRGRGAGRGGGRR